MKILIGFVVGLVWGGLVSAINSVVGNICVKKNTPESLTAYAYITNIIGIIALVVTVLLRNAFPFNGIAMIVGTAFALSSFGIIFALKLSSRK